MSNPSMSKLKMTNPSMPKLKVTNPRKSNQNPKNIIVTGSVCNLSKHI